MPHADTPADVQQHYDALWRQLTPEQRFQRGLSLIHFSRQLLWHGLRALHPQASEQALRGILCQQLYGVTLPRSEDVS